MQIRIFGPGCARCEEAENVVRAAVRETGAAATVEKVTDFKEMMALGVLSTPAVAVDGKVMCSGRVPSAAEVTAWMAAAGKDETAR